MAIETQIRKLLNVFVLLFVVISASLVYWQVLWPDSAPAKGHVQNDFAAYRPCVIADEPVRGNIYDRNGVKLAWSEADPHSPCGWRRRYSYPSLSPVIGYFSYVYGSTGIEAQYNGTLTGAGDATNFADAATQYWNRTLHKTVYGTDVYLSIDVHIQQELDKVFDNEACGAHTDRGSIIVEDPRNGQILGMLSRPYFNADTIGDPTRAKDDSGLTVGQEYWTSINSDQRHLLLNRATQGQYTPGSVMKTLTLAAAIDSGKYNAASGFTQEEASSFSVDGYHVHSTDDVVNDYRNGPEPPTFPMDLIHAYAYSDDYIFANVGIGVGKDTWLNYAQRFALSTPAHIQDLPIDLPNTSVSWAYTPQKTAEWNRDRAAFADAAWGQGPLFVTPMTMSIITSAVGANGQVFAPRLLLKTVGHNTDPKTVGNNDPVVFGDGPAFSAQTAIYIRQAMRADVEYGTVGASGGSIAAIGQSPANIGGKTGTAQTEQNEPHDWFISIAPARADASPANLAVVIMKENGGTSGACQAPIAGQIYDFALPLVR